MFISDYSKNSIFRQYIATFSKACKLYVFYLTIIVMDETEKKVISEETAKPTETVTVTASAVATTPKKKANILVILLAIIGILGVLCAVCGGTGIWLLSKTLQTTEQATTVTTLFEGLNEGDVQKVNSVSGEKLYTDLYDDTDGSVLADAFKGAYEKMVFTSVNITNTTATVEFKITGKGTNKKAIETITYAELQSDDNGWYVTYFGQKDSDE
jgi:hypothetical protein